VICRWLETLAGHKFNFKGEITMALTDEGNGGIPATMLVGPTGYAGGMPYPVYQGGNGGFGNGGDGW
jgi:hypothetical protein